MERCSHQPRGVNRWRCPDHAWVLFRAEPVPSVAPVLFSGVTIISRGLLGSLTSMRKTDKSFPPARNPAVSIVPTTYLWGLCLPWGRIDSSESVRWPMFWPAHERFGAGPGLLQRFSRTFFIGSSWPRLRSAFLGYGEDIDANTNAGRRRLDEAGLVGQKQHPARRLGLMRERGSETVARSWTAYLRHAHSTHSGYGRQTNLRTPGTRDTQARMGRGLRSHGTRPTGSAAAPASLSLRNTRF